jgi:hypothetical protein
MSLSDKQIDELKAKHGADLAGVTDEFGNIYVLKRPSRADFDRWFDSDRKTPDARQLVESCLVYPSTDVMIAALDKQPGLLQCRNGLLDAAVNQTGFKEGAASIKKL